MVSTLGRLLLSAHFKWRWLAEYLYSWYWNIKIRNKSLIINTWVFIHMSFVNFHYILINMHILLLIYIILFYYNASTIIAICIILKGSSRLKRFHFSLFIFNRQIKVIQIYYIQILILFHNLSIFCSYSCSIY